MPKQIELSQVNYQAQQSRPIDNSAFVSAAEGVINAGAFVAEQSAFKQLSQDVASLEQSYVNERSADQQAFADVRAQLAVGNSDADTKELQAQAVKLASKLRQGGNSLDYVTKLQVATKQAKMRAPWAADKLEATFQKYVGSEGASAIYSDYQSSQKLQQQYQQQLLADASEMGLHPADPFLEEKVMQGKADAYKLKTKMAQLQAGTMEDEVLSRDIITTSYKTADNQIESVVSAVYSQFGDLNSIPVEQKSAYVQKLLHLRNNMGLYTAEALGKHNITKVDREHLNSMQATFNNKVDALIQAVNGELDANIFAKGMSITENKELLSLYNASPSLFNAVTLGTRMQGSSFLGQVFDSQTTAGLVNWIKTSEIPKDQRVRSGAIGRLSQIMADPKADAEASEIVGSTIIDALDKGVRSPSSMSAKERDMLIDAYRNPKAKQYFDKDKNALPVLERAVTYKMWQELPGVLKDRYDAQELKQVQANVATNGQMTFSPLKVSGGNFEKAQAIAKELNAAVAPKYNKVLQTWAAYSGDQSKITLNPYAKLRNTMPVVGAQDVELPVNTQSYMQQAEPVEQDTQPKVRRIIRRSDGSLGDAE